MCSANGYTKWANGLGIDSSLVAPNVFPLGNSHMPAMNCARPPQNMAIPTTALGAMMCRAPALYSESIKVVDANEKRPLSDWC